MGSTKEKAKESQTKLKQQVNCLKSQNNQIIKEHSKLRSRFRDSLKLLQNYQVKLDQMETSQSVEQKSISSDHKAEKQTEQIQKEITDLKQLILDLHAKEQKVKSTQKPTPRPQQQTYSHQKRSAAARHSMIYDRNNPLIDDDDDDEIQLDDLRDLSPIPK